MKNLIRDAFYSVIQGRRVFAQLAAKPAPNIILAVGTVAIYGTVALAVNFALSLSIWPSQIPNRFLFGATVAALALMALIAFSFFAAGVLNIITYHSGATNNFARSYQTVTLLAPLLVVQSLLGWLPWAWVAVTVFAAWQTVPALETLHKLRPYTAWAATTMLAVAVLGAQWTAQSILYQATSTLKMLQHTQSQIEILNSHITRVQPHIEPLNGVAGAPDNSGVNLITSPQVITPDTDLEHNTASIIHALNLLLDNPALLRSLPPEQVHLLRNSMRELSSDTSLTDAQRAQKIQQVQQLMLEALKKSSL